MRSTALFVVLALAGCGGKPAPATTSPTPVAKAPLPDVPFDQLDHDQRKQFMEEKVMPVMKPIFVDHDAKRYTPFQCETCHGKGAAEGHFDMPNPELPKLDFKDMSKWRPEDLGWMKGQVLPTMAKTLKTEMYSPENPKGFGCLDCHTQAGT